MDALIVVDMQNACFESAPRYRAEAVIANINRLIAHFREAGKPVVHIQHQELSGVFAKDSHGWQFLPAMDVAPDDAVVAKSCCDAFIDTSLADLLRSHRVTRLFITGCATDFCVDSTLKGAIANGFDVVAVGDAHATADRPHVKAADLISHFNWNWAELITGNRTIRVVSTPDLLHGATRT